MAAENYGPAWSTKLDNPPAKQVLVLLANEAGVTGVGCLRLKLMAERSELSLRTVRRMIQVFEAIGLVWRCDVADHWGRMVPGFQLNMQMLGGDLREEFDVAYRAISGKGAVSETADEDAKTVSATGQTVSATAQAVSETAPPHPLNGSSVSVPLPSRAGGAADDGLDAEQQAHLARCSPEDRPMWEAAYREQNLRERNAAAEREQRESAERAREAELRAKMPTLKTAVAWVFAECHWVRRTGRDELAEIVKGALVGDAGEGREYWRSARKLANAWLEYKRAAPMLRWQYGGPEKFIATGAWLDEQAWPWDERQIERAEARAGNFSGPRGTNCVT